MRLLPALSLLLPCVSACAMSLPEPTVAATCGVQLKAGNHGPADLDQVRAMGATFIRRGFLWGEVEREKGAYDFTSYDLLVANAEARGLLILGCIALGNGKYPHVNTPEGREGFARFAAACAERYKGRCILWEIWNEPNVRTFWGKHGTANTPAFAHEYAALVNACAPAMRAKDPDCYIMAGSVSCLGWSAVDPWMDTCFADGVLTSGINAWSVHPYSLKRPEDYAKAYADCRALMAKHVKVPLPLINSERGYPIIKAEGWTGGEGDFLQFQAWHFVRQHLLDRVDGVGLTNWYEWSGKEGFSLIGAKGPTPAHAAGVVMLAQLGAYRFDRRLDPQDGQDYVLRFTGPGGAVKLAAWTAPKRGETPDKAVAHDLAVPVEASGELAVIALDGTAGKAPVVDGKVTLKLTAAPQYVTVK